MVSFYSFFRSQWFGEVLFSQRRSCLRKYYCPYVILFFGNTFSLSYSVLGKSCFPYVFCFWGILFPELLCFSEVLFSPLTACLYWGLPGEKR